MNKGTKKELAVISSGLGLLLTIAGRKRLGSLSVLAGSILAGLAFAEKRYSYLGKNVLITGGSRGLGLSLAWNLLAQGARVTLLARDEDELKRAKEILLKTYPLADVFIVVCDVTDADLLRSAVDKTIASMGGLDVLINNAGAILVGPFESMTPEDFEAQIKLHLYAAVNSVRFVLPHFRNHRKGKIINISSMGGKVGVPHMLPYDTSKFALAGFSQGINAELAEFGVSVTTVYPTVMRTGSPIQAVFKGDHEKEFAWFQTADLMPGLSMSADVAAKKILKASADGQSEVILSLSGKARMLLGAVAPETCNWLMQVAASSLPAKQSEIRKTGADSSGLFARGLLRWLFAEKAERKERMYNQVPKHDANRALGIH